MANDAFSKYHPLTNFLYFLGAIGFSVVIQHPLYLAVSCTGAGLYLVLLKGRKGLALIAGLIPVFLVLSLINPFFNTYGSHVLFSVFGRPYSLEALFHGMATAAVFVAMMLWFGCYGTVLTSDKFVCLFGSLIPALSLLLVMILRMIPGFMRKAEQIAGVRRSIGKGIGEAEGFREKAVQSMDLLSALTDWALEGSIITADSMRARGYGTARRTSFHLYRLTGTDIFLLALSLTLAAVVILSGGMGAEYTPELSIDAPTWGLAAYWVYVLIPSGLHILENIRWRLAVSRIGTPGKEGI